MNSFKLGQQFFLGVLFLSLAACGSKLNDVRLPDDPSNEEQVVPGNDSAAATPTAPEVQTPISSNAEDAVLSKYDFVDPNQLVPDAMLKKAVLYYDANKANIKNKDFLSVIDFSQHSGKKRFYIINMKTGAVWNIRVAHGKGSDSGHDGFLDSFSNVSGSNATSSGFYKTAETYSGAHGLSLRLDGLSSTNSNARSRAIVIHGADYVQEDNVIQGRSWGCPAVAMENRDKVVSSLKGGSIIFASK